MLASPRAAAAGISPLILDHTGATLYVPATVGGLCDSTEHLSFTIDKPTGGLRFLGSTSQTFLFDTPLSISANNLFAYGTDCVDFQGELHWTPSMSTSAAAMDF